MLAGILFADIRGFTARFDGGNPEEAASLLRRFYSCAGDVLFPDAVIDKLIGDEVMALYLPEFKPDLGPGDIPAVMLDHARGLLRAVGYGSSSGPPLVELGIGLDLGEAFVGNIGQRARYDFTAVGDVVNTAARPRCPRRRVCRTARPAPARVRFFDKNWPTYRYRMIAVIRGPY